ncbi:MAG TPA: hypothetical protein VJ599_03965 [Nitrososphaeraceae archaeon]|nr:hypothetical protein [Nitrososphaeraceae archaeon]
MTFGLNRYQIIIPIMIKLAASTPLMSAISSSITNNAIPIIPRNNETITNVMASIQAHALPFKRPQATKKFIIATAVKI